MHRIRHYLLTCGPFHLSLSHTHTRTANQRRTAVFFFGFEARDCAPLTTLAERQAGTSCDTARGFHYLHMIERVRVRVLERWRSQGGNASRTRQLESASIFCWHWAVPCIFCAAAAADQLLLVRFWIKIEVEVRGGNVVEGVCVSLCSPLKPRQPGYGCSASGTGLRKKRGGCMGGASRKISNGWGGTSNRHFGSCVFSSRHLFFARFFRSFFSLCFYVETLECPRLQRVHLLCNFLA